MPGSPRNDVELQEGTGCGIQRVVKGGWVGAGNAEGERGVRRGGAGEFGDGCVFHLQSPQRAHLWASHVTGRSSSAARA